MKPFSNVLRKTWFKFLDASPSKCWPNSMPVLAYTVKPAQSDHPMVQVKVVFVGGWSLFAGFIHRCNSTLTMEEVTGTKKPQHQKKLKWVAKKNENMIGKVSFFSAWALLGGPPDFFRWASRKKYGCGLSDDRFTQGKGVVVHEKPGRWSCKAAGRYSQRSFCMKPSVHEKPVVGSRWSLKPGFTVLL